MEKGLDSYNNHVARIAGEATGDMDASSVLSFVKFMAFINAWKEGLDNGEEVIVINL